MKLVVFADEERQRFLKPILSARGGYALHDSYDSFIRALPQGPWDAVLVAHKGAAGMQSVRAARILLQRVPVVWFSDDSGFLEESYRMGCVFFSAEAITQDQLWAALARCESERGN